MQLFGATQPANQQDRELWAQVMDQHHEEHVLMLKGHEASLEQGQLIVRKLDTAWATHATIFMAEAVFAVIVILLIGVGVWMLDRRAKATMREVKALREAIEAKG